MTKALSRIKNNRLSNAFVTVESNDIYPLSPDQLNPDKDILVPSFNVPEKELATYNPQLLNRTDTDYVFTPDAIEASGRSSRYLHDSLIDAMLRGFDFSEIWHRLRLHAPNFGYNPRGVGSQLPCVDDLWQAAKGLLKLVSQETPRLFSGGFLVNITGDSLRMSFIHDHKEVFGEAMGIRDVSGLSAWVVSPGYVIRHANKNGSHLLKMPDVEPLVCKFDFDVVHKYMTNNIIEWAAYDLKKTPSPTNLVMFVYAMSKIISERVTTVTCSKLRLQLTIPESRDHGTLDLTYRDNDGAVVAAAWVDFSKFK